MPLMATDTKSAPGRNCFPQLDIAPELLAHKTLDAVRRIELLPRYAAHDAGGTCRPVHPCVRSILVFERAGAVGNSFRPNDRFGVEDRPNHSARRIPVALTIYI